MIWHLSVLRQRTRFTITAAKVVRLWSFEQKNKRKKAGVSDRNLWLMLLLFYFLFKIIKLVSVEKLCKRNTESVTYLFNGVQFRIHAFPIKDIIINAVMFLLIHFPIWIASGIFIDEFTSLNFLCVPALSIIFSWSFIKSKNIWIPITLHMYWDLLMDLFY